MTIPAPESVGIAGMSTPPELAVVVLAVGAPPELTAAVGSLMRQTVPVEIIVINSGGGDPRSLLSATAPNATILSFEDRLWPGAARNQGIEATQAQWIAFMASDHIALENWAESRLARHRVGHAAVACAVINSHPNNLFAWACHLAILVRRLPGVPPEEAGLYGVSYDRKLFDRHGKFRTDLRIGEDTEFNARLSPDEKPLWAPEVQTVHENTTTLTALLRDMYARGRRSGLHWPRGRGGGLLNRAAVRFRTITSLALQSVKGRDRIMVLASLPILLLALLVHQYGIRAGQVSRQESARAD